MPRRRRVCSLQRLCLLNIATNMDSYWCRDYELKFGGQGLYMYTIGPFEYMTNANIQELLTILLKNKKIRRVHFDLLLTTNLTKLHLHFSKHVNVTVGAVSKLIGLRCQKLTELTLIHDGTKISVSHLSSLVSSLPHLTYLDLSQTSANDQVVTSLARVCTRLQTLRLRCCPLTECSVFALCMGQDHAPCLSIQTLDLHGTALKTKSLAMLIDKLPNLRHLLHDDVLRPLLLLHNEDPLIPERTHNLQTLTGYSLPDLPLPESDTMIYQKVALYCPHITILYFVDLPSNDCLKYFHNHPLRSVTIYGIRGDGHVTFEGGILPLIEHCGKRLETLCLSNIDSIDVGLIGLNCPNLRKLEILLYDLAKFTIYYTRPNRPVFGHLEDLHLAQKDGLSNGTFAPILAPLLSSAHKLKHLDLVCIPAFDDITLGNALECNKFEQLQVLLLSECNNITYTALLEVIMSSRELERLEMMSCHNIYRRDYDILIKFLKANFYEVDVSWT